MENIEIFYRRILAELKQLQTERLLREKYCEFKVDVHEKWTDTWKARSSFKKNDKLRKKISNGYHCGVKNSIQRVNKIYKEFLKKCEND